MIREGPINATISESSKGSTQEEEEEKEDWIGYDSSGLQKLSCLEELQCLSSSINPVKLAAPPQTLSYPEPRRTPCCHTAAGGQDVSALAPLPRCLCCPRCPSGQKGDMGPTGRSKGHWQAADWGAGLHRSSGSPPRRRQDWPDRDPGRCYLLHCWPWERPSVLAAVWSKYGEANLNHGPIFQYLQVCGLLIFFYYFMDNNKADSKSVLYRPWLKHRLFIHTW